jgi:cyclophilin family peptidyl-prolyl cis-trans isomerase/HEAT repeat protein
MLKSNAARRTFLALSLIAIAACVPQEPRADADHLHQVLAADDQRGTEAALATLRTGLRSPVPDVRAAAVRALGRLEQPLLSAEIGAVAREDNDPAVRRVATHALAQSVFNDDGAGVAGLLAAALADDPDPAVRRAAATSLGRLRYSDPGRAVQTELLLSAAAAEAEAEAEVVAGAARGLAALFRGQPDLAPTPNTVATLQRVAAASGGSAGTDADTDTLARIAATAALVSVNQLQDSALEAAAASRLPEVRRLAASALRNPPENDSARFDAALSDGAPQVRLEALRALRTQSTDFRCTRYAAALDDAWVPARLTAIDGLGSCPGDATALVELADGLPSGPWQVAAHALVSLSRVAPEAAAARLAAASRDTTWQVRMYAARAGGELGDVALLRELTNDPVPNVQHAALRGLQAHVGHAADDEYAAALESPDYQVVMAAANGLVDSPGNHLEPLLTALDRITTEERDTSRDPRAALLRAVSGIGGAADASRLEPYLADFDSVIAAQAAEILTAWTGSAAAATPRSLPPQPFPTRDELEEIAATTATLRMANGDTITLRFFPFEAPTHAARFVRLASAGALDGLTLHRVAFNFVLQGGSPGANEFMGHGFYTRDEITARSHRRGTLGTSTRGRDTGDGQLFINLVDNLRLDFNYTIFAEIVDGIEAIDNVLEGAVITAVTLARRD